MNEYLSFRRLITPTIVQLLFWLGLVVIVLHGLITMFGHSFWAGLLILLFGPILLRIYCEIVIVLFRINNTLTDLFDLQKTGTTRPPETPLP